MPDMKRIILFIVFISSLCHTGISQTDTTKKSGPNIKQFWLVVLKTGPKDKVITDSAERSKIFAGHFSNMERLYNDGVLKAAGPFGKNDFTWRGLFILDCKTREDAEAYVKTDPTIVAGIFIVDIVPWYSEPTGSFAPGVPKKNN
jgi:uncharacterized protein YciI